MMDAASRVLQFIDFKGFSESRKGKSIRTFYAEVGLSNASIKIGRGIGSEALYKISSKYPDLNMDWVINGRGKMLYTESTNMIVGADIEPAKIAIDALKDRVNDLSSDLISCMKEKEVLRKEKEELVNQYNSRPLHKEAKAAK